MVIKSPKGSAVPLYFKPGSRQKILSLYGAPSVKYPLIQDAIDFNDQYGLYLSAPAGGTELYPSYYGGMYVTDYGPFNFDRVGSKDVPNFNGIMVVGNEVKLGEASPATKNLTGTTITLENVKPTTWQLAKGLRIKYSKVGSALYGTSIECTFTDKLGTPKVTTLVAGVAQEIGTVTVNAGVYTVNLPGTNSNVENGTWGISPSAANDYVTAITGLGSDTLDNAFTFEWVLDLSNNTYFYLAQRSPTDEVTTVSIKKISMKVPASAAINATVIGSTGHGFIENDQVVFSGDVPPQITVGRRYYVLPTGLTANEFKIANSRGGNPITFATQTGFTTTKNFYVRDYTYEENVVSFSVSEAAYGSKLVSDGLFTGSLISTSVNANGVKNYLPLLLPQDGGTLVEAYVVKPFGDTITTKTPAVSYSLTGQRYASKSDALIGNVLQEGWDHASAGDYDSVLLFMEPSGDDTLKATLAALRSSTYKTATFIAHIAETTANGCVQARSASPDSRGVAYYANKLLRDENYTNTQFWSSCIGAIGIKLANIMERKMGGWAPHFTDFGGLGGSLNVSARKQLIKWGNEDQQLADKEGLNIIVMDSFQGPMIIGQKTAQDPGNITDWSFLAHSMAFDIIKREIGDLVLIPQLGKPIDDKFMGIRQTQADAILVKRLAGPNKIWSAGVADAFSFNDDNSKAAGNFKLSLKVKVTKFSETIELILEDVAQSATI